MPKRPPTDISSLSLAEIAKLAEEQRLPPVDHWHPDHCGHSDMRIAADGTWFHAGSPIGRAEMVRLFSTILRREADGSFVLVTPAEKLTIDVEDAPFIAVEVKRENEGATACLAFRLNTGDVVIAGPDHPVELRGEGEDIRPYLRVRGGLEALVSRPVYYELAELALDERQRAGHAQAGIWSNGSFFPMEPTG